MELKSETFVVSNVAKWGMSILTERYALLDGCGLGVANHVSLLFQCDSALFLDKLRKRGKVKFKAANE